MSLKKWESALDAILTFSSVLHAQIEPMAPGKFEPTWESLSQYKVPEWYRDAKFGIWAHWGPQCQPEQGDWFARFMEKYGAPFIAGKVNTNDATAVANITQAFANATKLVNRRQSTNHRVIFHHDMSRKRCDI